MQGTPALISLLLLVVVVMIVAAAILLVVDTIIPKIRVIECMLVFFMTNSVSSFFFGACFLLASSNVWLQKVYKKQSLSAVLYVVASAPDAMLIFFSSAIAMTCF